MSDDKSSVAADLKQGPPPWFIRLYMRVHVFIYKLSKGRMMGVIDGKSVVMIDMVGAKSGKQRTIALMYVPHGEGFLLVGSLGGAPVDPAWCHNLRKHPNITVTYEGKAMPMKARQLSDDEKAEVWPTCVEFFPPYDDYQTVTTRNIPVFQCAP